MKERENHKEQPYLYKLYINFPHTFHTVEFKCRYVVL